MSNNNKKTTFQVVNNFECVPLGGILSKVTSVVAMEKLERLKAKGKMAFGSEHKARLSITGDEVDTMFTKITNNS